MAEPVQRLARGGIAQFGLVAQREQRFVAAGLGPGAGDRQHRLGIEIDRLPGPRRVGEGAVVAHVAAQLGQRDKDFGRIGDEIAVALVAQFRRGFHQRPQIGDVALGQRQRLVGGEPLPGQSPRQNLGRMVIFEDSPSVTPERAAAAPA